MFDLASFLDSVVQHPLVKDAAIATGVLLAIICIRSVRLCLFRVLKSIDTAFTNETKKLGTATSNFNKIETELLTLRLAMNADRINIYQFHNGSEFLLGGSIFKLICSHEVARDGLQFDSLKINSTLVSTIMDYVNPVMGSEESYPGVKRISWCRKTKDANLCELKPEALRVVEFRLSDMKFSNFKYIMGTQGTVVMYAVLLTDAKTGNPLGILNIQFIDDDADVSAVQSKVCDLCLSISKLQYLLTT